MKIIFLGSGSFGLPALQALPAAGHQVLHVVSQPDRPAGRGGRLTATPVATWASEHAISLSKPADVNTPDILQMLRKLQPDCLVVIAFGQKLSPELLSIAPHGGINLHASLLPKFRGAAPINWTIISGDAEAGVTVIEVASIMDGGAMLAQERLTIEPAETAGELHDRLSQLGQTVVPQVLNELATGRAHSVPQDPALASRAPKLSRQMAWIDWTRPATEVSARIRGLSPWPLVAVDIIDAEGKLRTRAAILKCQTESLTGTHDAGLCGRILPDHAVACGTGSLRLLTLQPAGKKAMDAAACARGYGLSTGARLVSAQPIV